MREPAQKWMQAPERAAVLQATGELMARVAIAFAGEERNCGPAFPMAWGHLAADGQAVALPVLFKPYAHDEAPFVLRPMACTPPIPAPSREFQTFDAACAFVEAAPGFQGWTWVCWIRRLPEIDDMRARYPAACARLSDAEIRELMHDATGGLAHG